MMRTLQRAALAAWMLAAAAPVADGAPLETEAFARVNATLVETHVLPRYARLSAATDAFAAAAGGLCAGPGDGAARDRARARFQDAMTA